MKVIGIVVEYNPFHNGHLYHINKVKEIAKPDILVAVMSGNFVMRGEPAIQDKFKRTDFALNNGVDLVVELPIYNTIQSADNFCNASVTILEKLNCSEMYFGSETGDIELLKKMASNIRNVNKEDYKKLLKEGNSHNTIICKLSNSRLNSNDILGVSYINSIVTNNFKIIPKTITRNTSSYNEKLPTSANITSATAIRLDLSLVNDYTPNNTNINYHKPVYLEEYENEIIHFIKIHSKEYLNTLLHSSEGLSNLIKNNNKSSINEIYESCVNKRFSKSRVNRFLISCLLNIKEDSSMLDISYIRVLGFNSNGQKLLSILKDELNIITKVKNNISDKLDLDILSSEVYSSKSNNDTASKEFLKPIILK